MMLFVDDAQLNKYQKEFQVKTIFKEFDGGEGIEWLISQQMMSTCVNCSRNIQFSFFISLHVQLSKAN